ncbi:MAG TPA: phosphatidylglycerol lysyltransferase domain-containing protein [Nocardioidaceae bacterium]|nr:phosphatidylglycerol lysyltransferase domain-containing protein [Nocardioidaceae bacterium]
MLKTLTTPAWVARIVGLVGALTLLSAVLPAVHDRARIIAGIVPPVFPAAATTGAAAVGVILVVLSRALRRGKFRAWLLATVLSALATVLHVVKGLDIEEAVLSGALFVLLLTSRKGFTAKPDPRSVRRVVTVLTLGTALATVLGWIWLSIDRDGQAPGTTWLDRLAQAFLGLLGIPGPVQYVDQADATSSAVALVVLGAAVLLFAVLVALQPTAGPHPMTDPERSRVDGLLDRWGAVDSLSYFALRDDRSAIFSPSGKAAITYRVVGTVSLAAGDPLGDPEAWPGAISVWLQEAREYGWVPAVLGASERGAEAFHRAGLDALELGDEAILHTDEFSLEGRSMRVVRQAVSRCTRAGLTVTCHRVADLDEGTRAAVLAHADAWRDGEVERGFSMALGRLADPVDGRAVVVLSTDDEGQLRGLLQLVPWGPDGLSLDVMRRDRAAENGIVEQMVTGLMAQAPALGVCRVSLNFAVFRSVFARGERLGAGPVLRLWRSVLLAASRFWQIESLYRANAKFQPVWTPRFICFRSSADLPRVSVAALRAEAFLVAPAWLKRLLPS